MHVLRAYARTFAASCRLSLCPDLSRKYATEVVSVFRLDRDNRVVERLEQRAVSSLDRVKLVTM